MADTGRVRASVLDSDGHEVVLLVRIWGEKIAVDHPELAGYREAVVETVSRPDRVELDVLPGRTCCYRRNVGPSRWLLVVVSYEQQPARIITAVANRKVPKHGSHEYPHRASGL